MCKDRNRPEQGEVQLGGGTNFDLVFSHASSDDRSGRWQTGFPVIQFLPFTLSTENCKYREKATIV